MIDKTGDFLFGRTGDKLNKALVVICGIAIIAVMASHI